MAMEPPARPGSSSGPSNLFQVFLRLRPPPPSSNPTEELYPILRQSGRFLTVERSTEEIVDGRATQITINPPSDSRRRAIEKFAFTKVFEEQSSQLDIFAGTGAVPLLEGVLGPNGSAGRDGLLATLGVTGSGKTHTILGSRAQRGLTQMTLEVLYRSLRSHLLNPSSNQALVQSLSASDPAESSLLPATGFLESYYGDGTFSRAATPMTVGQNNSLSTYSSVGNICHSLFGLRFGSPSKKETRPSYTTRSNYAEQVTKFRNASKDTGSLLSSAPRRNAIPRPTSFAKSPDISDILVGCDTNTEYAIVISMYEVYNDRIFDLLNTNAPTTGSAAKHIGNRDLRRRPLLFKSTEHSPYRKVVAGLTKIVCGTVEDALTVLETGLTERRTAGTGSNLASSRSHGFFCIEIKKRGKFAGALWTGSTMTIVDLAGSERAREAKTAGATLAEAGKINESLMYLGQCLQMQSDASSHGNKPTLVPFRQCKLTELLFSNSFPSASTISSHGYLPHRTPQKAVMVVTADPLGDFNATSQILRYSALAREVTVPRIPSVASTILSGTTANGKSRDASGRSSPSSISAEELEFAAGEIARLTEELDIMTIRYSEEHDRRHEAESAWQVAEQRCEAVEQEIREECSEEMERRIAEERLRWINARAEEADRNDEHMDRKLDILSRSIKIHEDAEPAATETQEELERENESLRAEMEQLKREMNSRSPTKSKRPKPKPYGPLRSSQVINLCEDTDNEIEKGLANLKLRDSTDSTPDFTKWFGKTENEPPAMGRSARKLTTRKWDLLPEDEI
ncbi:MAG: hypothetical protein M1814_003573 [Vezdaea aestivalis]|nr:MAG: hypothetical protein M1814_003573 [Vezdaea aestivalis]